MGSRNDRVLSPTESPVSLFVPSFQPIPAKILNSRSQHHLSDLRVRCRASICTSAWHRIRHDLVSLRAHERTNEEPAARNPVSNCTFSSSAPCRDDAGYKFLPAFPEKKIPILPIPNQKCQRTRQDDHGAIHAREER